jgi:hypothetical protein
MNACPARLAALPATHMIWSHASGVQYAVTATLLTWIGGELEEAPKKEIGSRRQGHCGVGFKVRGQWLVGFLFLFVFAFS